MANEIQTPWSTGATVYAIVRNATGQPWNTAGAAFEAFNASNFTDYDIALTEQGASGWYSGNMPGVAAGVYAIETRERAGGSPAQTDERIGTMVAEWDGSAIVPLSSRSTVTTSQVNTECDTALSEVGLTTTITGRIDAAVSTRLASAGYTAPDNPSIAAILVDTNEMQTDLANGGRLDLLIDAILADTGTDGVAISAATANQIADALLTRDWSSVSGESARSVLNALRLLRNKVSESGGTLTVTKEDDSTSAWTAAVTTSASAAPIVTIDPA